MGATPAAGPEPGVIHCQGLGLGSGRPFSAWAANRSGCKHNGICNQEYQNPSENNDLHSKSQNPRKKHAISTQGGQNLCETNAGALESARFMIKKRHLQGCQSHCKDKCICRKDGRILVKTVGPPLKNARICKKHNICTQDCQHPCTAKVSAFDSARIPTKTTISVIKDSPLPPTVATLSRA